MPLEVVNGDQRNIGGVGDCLAAAAPTMSAPISPGRLITPMQSISASAQPAASNAS